MNLGPPAGVPPAGAAGASANPGSMGPGLASPAPAPAPDVFRALLARQAADGSPLLGPEILAVPRWSAAPRTGRGPTVQRPWSLEARRGAADDDDPVDPLRRHRAALQPPEMLASCTAVAPATPLQPVSSLPTVDRALAAVSLEDLVPALVRRIAWSGDGKRGTARLEIGSGELAGATLLVAAEKGRVEVHLNVPPGVDAMAWEMRIRRRLESRSIVADSVEVT